MDEPAVRPMGPKTEEVLVAIRTHMRRYGYPPTIREMGRAVGLSSTSVIAHHLRQLVKHGHIGRLEYGASRGLIPLDAWVTFAGDEVLGETADGERVVVRLIEPVVKAA